MFRETSGFSSKTDGLLTIVVFIYFTLIYFNRSPTLRHEFVPWRPLADVPPP